METRLTEVAGGIYQLTTDLEAIDFAVNQYLLAGEEPLLFHTGTRRIYPLVSQAIAEVLSIESLRWIGFGHVEADECGAKDNLLAVAPASTVVEGTLGCMVTIGDMASRPPRPVARGDKLDIGGHCVEWIDTRHVPHAWEAGVLYDHTTKVLLCGDLSAAPARTPYHHRPHRRASH